MALYLNGEKYHLLSNNELCSLDAYFTNIGEAFGSNIVIPDGADAELLNTKIYGKTVVVNAKSYQLFNSELFSTQSMGGATVTNNGDGSFTISGSGTLTENFVSLFFYSHEETVELLRTGAIFSKFGAITNPCLNYYLEDKVNGTSLYLASNSWNANYDSSVTEEMLSSPTANLVVGFWGSAGSEIKPGTIKPMIYQDGDGTWEPFATSTATISRQLFDADLFPTKTIGNVTIKNNEDGSFTVSGTGDTIESLYANLHMYTHEETIHLLKPGMFYATFGAITYPCCTYYLENKVTGESLTLAQNGWGLSAAVEISADLLYKPDTKLVVGFGGDAGSTIISGTLKPMMYQQGDGNWQPFKGVLYKSSGLYSIGANEEKIDLALKTPQLFDASKIPSFSQGGATITNNGDGSFTVTGSGNLTSDVGKDFRYTHDETVKLLKAGNLYSNYSSMSNPYMTFYLVNGGWNVIFTLSNYDHTNETQVITDDIINNPKTELLVAFYGDAGTKINPGTVKPMIYQDGNGEHQDFGSQNFLIPIKESLKGIPLGSTIPDFIAQNAALMDGVYFDDDQYWIGDTIDYGKKLLIRRIAEKVYDENTNIHQADSSLYYFHIGGDVNALMDSNAPIQSDYYNFTQNELGAMQNKECKFILSSEGKFVYLCNKTCSTVEDLKSELMLKPITVQYILNSPVVKELSDSELELYDSLHSYSGTTVITNKNNAFVYTKYFKEI